MISDGQVINDRYVLQYELGRGGMSKVYLARDIKLNMDWAIKVLDVSSKSSHAQIYKIATEKEVSLLKSLKHPALPRIVDYFLLDEKMYIVMDYIEGSTQLIDDKCRKSLTLDILSNNEKSCAGLNDLL